MFGWEVCVGRLGDTPFEDTMMADCGKAWRRRGGIRLGGTLPLWVTPIRILPRFLTSEK